MKKLFALPLLIILLNVYNSPGQKAGPSKPNIVIILADDFGVGDIRALYPKNNLPSPNLDRLVAQGMHFTDAHSASAVCTPSRYGLLTGRYAWRTQLQKWVLACYEPPLIEKDRLTLPKYLQQQGYKTACIGKWHLGMNWHGGRTDRRIDFPHALKNEKWDFTQPVADGPITRGFDEYFGVDVPNYPPFTFIAGDRLVMQPTDVYKVDTTEGVVLPGQFAGSPMAPGWRFEEILPRLTGRAVDYIHKQAKSHEPFFLYFPLTSPHEPVSPSKDFKGKSGISPIADFLMETDWAAGQIMKALEDAGIANNTILIFTSDNGHSDYTGWETLIKSGNMPSGPYRGHKADIWEGGHRIPLVVRWPGRVAAGKASSQLICLTDIFATCAEIAGKKPLPANAAEDSFGFLNILTHNGRPQARKSIVNHSVNGEFAYRSGPWKVVFRLADKKTAAAHGKPIITELYNLDNDLEEKVNVADKHPELVKQLTTGLQTVINRGTSRKGPRQLNDVHVRFDTVQVRRWAPLAGN